jgi:hypothetical protein
MLKCLLGLPTLTVIFAGISCWGAVRVGIANPNSVQLTPCAPFKPAPVTTASLRLNPHNKEEPWSYLSKNLVQFWVRF